MNILTRSIHVAHLLHVFLEYIPDFQRVLRYHVLRPVVLHAVAKHQIHVPDELVYFVVHIVSQLLLYRPEIHRLRYYVEVVVDPVLCRVHRFVEVVPPLTLRTHTQHPYCRLYPRVLRLYLL